MQCLAQHDSRDIATNRTRPRISRRKLSLLKQVTRIHRKQLCDVAHYECTRRRSLTAICPQFSQNRQHLHANLRASEREIMIRRITRPFPVGRAANQFAHRSRLHEQWPYERDALAQLPHRGHARKPSRPRATNQSHQHRFQHIISMVPCRNRIASGFARQLTQLAISLRSRPRLDITAAFSHTHVLRHNRYTHPRSQFTNKFQIRRRLARRAHVVHHMPDHKPIARFGNPRSQRQHHRR